MCEWTSQGRGRGDETVTVQPVQYTLCTGTYYEKTFPEFVRTCTFRHDPVPVPVRSICGPASFDLENRPGKSTWEIR